MKRAVLSLVLVALVTAGCGSSSPSSPTTPTPTPTPTPVVSYVVSGTVSSAAGGAIPGATVSIGDGLNAGARTTTDGSGRYTLNLTSGGGFTLNVAAASYVNGAKGITLTQSSPTATADFALLPEARWNRSGSGDSVFDMPTYIRRVRVVGTYGGYTSNFIVRVSGSLLVNELLGTGWGMTRYEGVLLTSGGVVAVTNSSGVSWSFTEER